MRQLFLEDAAPLPVKDLLRIMQQKVATGSTYFGIPTMKSPMDVWIYQEIITQIRPTVIIELGTWHGGSALLLAHLCDHLGNGRVISIDPGPTPAFTHPRISWIKGSAKDQFEFVRGLVSKDECVLVIEDSSHGAKQCLDVLETYGSLVTPGSYLIVEDTICHHGLDEGPQPGPYEAVEVFLKAHPEFEADRDREPYLITWNPKGYLKRIA